MGHTLGRVTAYLYDMVISRFLTVVSHVLMMDKLHFRPTDRLMMDVGIGTGSPLKAISGQLPSELKVVGVDINHAYIEACKEKFSDDPRMEIHELSFYDVERLGKSLYDIVFFSFSFMLMPDRKQALELAKRITKEDGRIVFMLTLNRSRNALFERLKPLIKRLTTVDFGQVVYENDFKELLESSNLTIRSYQRLYSKFNPLFWIFPIHYVEVGKRSNS